MASGHYFDGGNLLQYFASALPSVRWWRKWILLYRRELSEAGHIFDVLGIDSRASPVRLPLGSDTYNDIRASLLARLAEHDAHRDVAFSVTRNDI